MKINISNNLDRTYYIDQNGNNRYMYPRGGWGPRGMDYLEGGAPCLGGHGLPRGGGPRPRGGGPRGDGLPRGWA